MVPILFCGLWLQQDCRYVQRLVRHYLILRTPEPSQILLVCFSAMFHWQAYSVVIFFPSFLYGHKSLELPRNVSKPCKWKHSSASPSSLQHASGSRQELWCYWEVLAISHWCFLLFTSVWQPSCPFLTGLGQNYIKLVGSGHQCRWICCPIQFASCSKSPSLSPFKDSSHEILLQQEVPTLICLGTVEEFSLHLMGKGFSSGYVLVWRGREHPIL